MSRHQPVPTPSVRSTPLFRKGMLMQRKVMISTVVATLGWFGLTQAGHAATISDFTTTNTTSLQTADWVVGATFPEMQYFGANGQWAYLNAAQPYSSASATGSPNLQFGFMLTDTANLGSYSPAAPFRIASVTGFTLEGDNTTTASRKGLRNVVVHYGFGQTLAVTLPNTPNSQTVTFTSPILTPYMYITNAETDPFYDSSPFGTNNDIGIARFKVEGSWVDASNQTNYNALVTTTMSATNSTFNSPTIANDGNAQINGTSGIYFDRNANTDSLTATYASTVTIGSFALALTMDDNSGVRVYPTEVTVSYTGGSEVISLVGPNLSYGLYQLSSPKNTTFLTLTFPGGTSATGWEVLTGNQTYGIAEFQAFGVLNLTIPEPASFLMLGLSGLLPLATPLSDIYYFPAGIPDRIPTGCSGSKPMAFPGDARIFNTEMDSGLRAFQACAHH